MPEYTLTRTAYDTIAPSFNEVAKRLAANKAVVVKDAKDIPGIFSAITIETTPEAMRGISLDAIGWTIKQTP